MIRPDFFDKFMCKAGQCKHSCCMGWEIDVDHDTASYYMEMDDPFGEKIASAIYKDEDGFHFRLENDRCPFLRRDNLCEIIKKLGEGALCDICDLHPRFFFDIEEHEFAGLGACCEAVCDLLLDNGEPLRFFDDNGNAYTLDGIINMCFGVEEKIRTYNFEMSEEEAARIINLFSKTEPIDENWSKELKSLSDPLILSTVHPFDKSILRKIYEYIIFRQLERIPEVGLPLITDYAKLSTDFIVLHSVLTNDIKESLRRFSEQIEYSTENVDILFS